MQKESWERTTIGTEFVFQYGKSLPKEIRTNTNEYTVFGSSGPVGSHDKYLLNSPCIIIGRKGSAGSVYLSKEPSWPIDTTYFVIPSKEFDLSFSYYLFKHLGFEKLDRSTAIPGLNRDDAYALEFLKPPLSQQIKIVAKIDELFSQLDAAEAALKRAHANLKRYRQSVLQATVTGELTREWRESHQGEIEPASELIKKNSNKLGGFEISDSFVLPDLPDGWIWTNINSLTANEPFSITDGPFGSNLKTEHYTSSGPRVIRLQNIGDGYFNNAEAHISDTHYKKLKKHEIIAGDIVIAALGDSLPRSCIIPPSVGNAIVKADCIKVRPNLSIVNKSFLNSALNSELVKSLVKSIVHGIGRPRLNLGEIKSIPVPLPPREEQEVISSELESQYSIIQEIELQIENSIERIFVTRQSILKQAFSGQLQN